MGSGNRGQLRPHFAGRSPPFLVAALCIGICILVSYLYCLLFTHSLSHFLFSQAVSYYSLSIQSSSTEAKVAHLEQQYHDVTSELETCRSQLHAKERDFDKVKSELEQLTQESQVIKGKNDAQEKEVQDLKTNSEKQGVSVDV